MLLRENDLLLKEKEAKRNLELCLTIGIIEDLKRQTIVGCGQERGGDTCNYCTNDRSD